MGERRLAQPRRTEQQNVIERLFAFFRGLDEDRELAADFFLADVLVERARPQRAVEHFFLRVHRRGGDQAVSFDHRPIMPSPAASAPAGCQRPTRDGWAAQYT